MAEMVQPTFVATVQPRALPGDPNPKAPTDSQLEALNNILTPELVEALLDGDQEVVITVQRAQSAQKWIAVEPEPEPDP
jgi:hypothetical protein